MTPAITTTQVSSRRVAALVVHGSQRRAVGSSLDVVASVDRDGSELLASQRWRWEATDCARQTAMVQIETAAQLRRTAAELLETAAELCAQALELRAQCRESARRPVVGDEWETGTRRDTP
jgi:hypothetical protein